MSQSLLSTGRVFISTLILYIILLNTQVQLQEDLDQKARSSASIFLYLYTTVNYSWRQSIKYWTFYRGPGVLAVIWFDSTPAPSPSSPVSKLDKIGRLRKTGSLLTGEGGRGWAWSRIIWPQESLALYKSFTTLCDSQKRWKECLPCPHFRQDLALNIDTVCHRLSNMSKDIQLHAGIDKVLCSVHSSWRCRHTNIWCWWKKMTERPSTFGIMFSIYVKFKNTSH